MYHLHLFAGHIHAYAAKSSIVLCKKGHKKAKKNIVRLIVQFPCTKLLNL